MRTLVAFYSLTGTTERVAHALAGELGADLDRIACDAYRPGPLGFVQAGTASMTNRIPAIAPAAANPGGYDLVVIGGPVWAWNASTPVRAWLAREAPRLKRVAFFATVGGVGFDRAFATMAAIAGRQPVATLALTTEDFRQGRDHDRIVDFAATLRQPAPA